jgi:hypothetical protein
LNICPIMSKVIEVSEANCYPVNFVFLTWITFFLSISNTQTNILINFFIGCSIFTFFSFSLIFILLMNQKDVEDIFGTLISQHFIKFSFLSTFIFFTITFVIFKIFVGFHLTLFFLFLFIICYFCVLIIYLICYFNPNWNRNLHHLVKRIKFQMILNLIIWMYSFEGLKMIYQKFTTKKQDERKDIPLHELDSFQCVVSMKNLPDEIISEISSLDSNLDEFIVNPSLLSSSMKMIKESPSKFRTSITNFFNIVLSMKSPTFVMEDPGHQMIFTYSIGEEYIDLFNEFIPGKSINQSNQELKKLKELDLKFLKYSKILVHCDYWKERCQYFENYTKESNKKLEENGFIILKQILPKLQFLSLQKYFKNYLKRCVEENKNENHGFFYTWESEIAMNFNVKTVEMFCKITNERLISQKPLTLFYTKESSLPLHFDSFPYFYSCSVQLSKLKHTVPH